MKYEKIELDDALYPENLKQIFNPPKELYAIGNLDLLKEDMIAIVGTRKITNYGIKYTKKFATEISLRNIPIISGMAIGTDTEAHKTALKYGCPTIAVLGTGFDNIYPEENLKVFYEIIDSNGLILTEEPPETQYDSKNFSKRNRIVSGLSKCVLVIEAGYRSGTSVTVDYAKEQGKLVFAIPGRLDDKYSLYVNKFIKEGAILVTEINDILEKYPQFMNKKRKKCVKTKVKKEYQEVYDILQNNNCNIEDISKKLKDKSIREITNILTMMELEDLIIKDFGNGYKLKEENA